jgi:hypothetical protein
MADLQASEDLAPYADMTDLAPPCHVVINEVNTAGDEWVELFNPCSSSYSLSGHVLAYRGLTSSSDSSTVCLTSLGSLASGAYVIIGVASTTPPDLTWSLADLISSTQGGGLQLRTLDDTPLDSMAWASSGGTQPTNGFTETTATVADATGSMSRSPNGSDTDNNFATLSSTPRPPARRPTTDHQH